MAAIFGLHDYSILALNLTLVAAVKTTIVEYARTGCRLHVHCSEAVAGVNFEIGHAYATFESPIRLFSFQQILGSFWNDDNHVAITTIILIIGTTIDANKFDLLQLLRDLFDGHIPNSKHIGFFPQMFLQDREGFGIGSGLP